jgi:hypothetical protein
MPNHRNQEHSHGGTAARPTRDRTQNGRSACKIIPWLTPLHRARETILGRLGPCACPESAPASATGAALSRGNIISVNGQVIGGRDGEGDCFRRSARGIVGRPRYRTACSLLWTADALLRAISVGSSVSAAPP